jgi:putative lipoic acid-binding regulatory protein
MDDGRIKDFAEKLDKFYAWPALYTFKFIVKTGREQELRDLFPLHTDTSRASKNGNYTSITFQMMMPSAQAVIEVYQKAAVIEGIIAL